MNVFEITEKYRHIERLVDSDCDHIPDDDLLAAWLSVEDDLNTKVEHIGFAIKNRQATLAGTESAIADMQRRAGTLTNEIDRLKQLAIGLLQATDRRKAGGHFLQLSIVPNAPSVVIEDEAAIPPEYLRVIDPVPAWYAPDKKLMGEDMKAGVIAAGTKLMPSVRLSIK